MPFLLGAFVDSTSLAGRPQFCLVVEASGRIVGLAIGGPVPMGRKKVAVGFWMTAAWRSRP